MSMPQHLVLARQTCLNCHQEYSLPWFKHQLTSEEVYALLYGTWQPNLYPHSDLWVTCIKCRILAFAHDEGLSLFHGQSPSPNYTSILGPPHPQHPLRRCQQCPGEYTLPHFKAELTPEEVTAARANVYTWFTSDLPLNSEEQTRLVGQCVFCRHSAMDVDPPGWQQTEAFVSWPMEMEWQQEKVKNLAPRKIMKKERQGWRGLY